MKKHERHVTKSVTTYQCGCGCKKDCGCKKKKKSCGCKKPCDCEPEVKGCPEYVKIECIIDKEGNFFGEILSNMQAEILALQKANLALTQKITECCGETSANTPVPNQICVVENTIQLKSDDAVISSDTLPTTTAEPTIYTICEYLGDIALKANDEVVSILPIELNFLNGYLFLTSDGEEMANVEILPSIVEDIASNLEITCNDVNDNDWLQLMYGNQVIGQTSLPLDPTEGILLDDLFVKLLQTSDAGCEILRLIDGINPDDCN